MREYRYLRKQGHMFSKSLAVVCIVLYQNVWGYLYLVPAPSCCSSQNTDGGFTCACVDGYNGDKCETDIDDCASDSCEDGKEPCTHCENGGTCMVPYMQLMPLL